MSENLFFCAKIVSEKQDINRQIGDFCFKPLRYLFNGKTIEILNGSVKSEKPAFRGKTLPKTITCLLLCIPGTLIGTVPKLLASRIETKTVKLHFKTKNITPICRPTTPSVKSTKTPPAASSPQTLSLEIHAPMILKELRDIPLSTSLKNHYDGYTSSGSHAYKGQAIFKGADFLVRHGVMHTSFVSLNVRPVIDLYRELGDERVAKLTAEEIIALEVSGLYHDYGRLIFQNDLGGDTHDMEEKGAKACYTYLTEKMGISKEIAVKARDAILNKDIEATSPGALKNKCIFAEVLQNCDCLAVLRADDWEFDPKYLNAMMRMKAGDFAKPDSSAKVFELIEANKKFLIALGDSPFDMKSFTEPSQTFQGHFSLDAKQRFETAPNCYQLMKDEMLKFSLFKKTKWPD